MSDETEKDPEEKGGETEGAPMDQTMVGGPVLPPSIPSIPSAESADSSDPAEQSAATEPGTPEDLGHTMAGSAAPPVLPGGADAGGGAEPPIEGLDQTMLGGGAPPPAPPAVPPEGPPLEVPLDQTMAGAPAAAPPVIAPGGGASEADAPAKPADASRLVDADDALADLTLASELEMTIAGPPRGGAGAGAAVKMPVAPAQRPARLERTEPADRAGSIPLDPGKTEHVLGRSRECDVPLYTLSASRQHARLEWVDGKWFLEPFGDRQVSVDGKPISGRTALSHGSRLLLGEDELVLDDGSGPLPGRTLQAPPGPAPAASKSGSPDGPAAGGSNGRSIVLGLVVAVVVALVFAAALMSRLDSDPAEEAIPQAEEAVETSELADPAPVAVASAPAEAPSSMGQDGPGAVASMEAVASIEEGATEEGEAPAGDEESEALADGSLDSVEMLPADGEPPPGGEAALEEQAPEQPEAPGESVDELLARAAELQRQYKLMTPPGENAYELLVRVRALDASNAEAEAALGRMQRTYLSFARREIDKGELAAAESYLSRAERIAPANATRGLRAEVKERRREIALRRTIPARDPEASAPGASDAASLSQGSEAEEDVEEEESGSFFGLFD